MGKRFGDDDPKAFRWVGSTSSSASKKADFFIPSAIGPVKETTAPEPAAVTALSTCFWWPASSGPRSAKSNHRAVHVPKPQLTSVGP